MNEKFFDLKSEKQDKMINAALHLFAENGYKHASTDDIVREAGISKGLLFHYFINKEGLYSFLTDYSVKYLLFEFERAIGEETEYFAFWDKLEGAKVGVLRNYPYMYKFIDRCTKETDPDIKAMSNEALTRYNNAISSYQSKLTVPALRNGVSALQLQSLLRYTIDGLTSEHLAGRKLNPDTLYSGISDYISLIKKLTVTN